MPRFHEKTLALLGSEGVREKRSIQMLTDWARKNDVKLPAAYLEWAEFDDGSLLRKYSNDDWFWFDEPELVVTPDGVRGLSFNTENQNNYDRIVTLDQGDDPPVLYAWIGEPPWVTHAERFSDALFAQVFDWQFLLDFNADDMAYCGDISLRTDTCLTVLRQRYEELVSTRFIVKDIRYAEYRFLAPPALRLTVTVAEDRSTQIRVTGQPIEMVMALETELKSVLTPRI